LVVEKQLKVVVENAAQPVFHPKVGEIRYGNIQYFIFKSKKHMASPTDKIALVISFLLPLLPLHTPRSKPPFFLGISGPQGSGKSTLVSELSAALSAPPHGLTIAVISIDDFYLTAANQHHLSTVLHPQNRLLAHRGHPGTHDLALAHGVFSALDTQTQPVRLPRYDKSRLGGRGDRVEEDQWGFELVPPVDVVLFEGWCVGFRSVGSEEIFRRWTTTSSSENGEGLKNWRREELEVVDEYLRNYDQLTE
jgi:D-glycerate 3-kinase